MASTTARVELGKRGESLARRELERLGYAVLATRYRSRFGEIDIVCDDGGVVVFVEVKTRRTHRQGGAMEAVSRRKQRRISAMALDYLAWSHRLDRRCRFDVVAIDGVGTSRETLRVVPNAFAFDR